LKDFLGFSITFLSNPLHTLLLLTLLLSLLSTPFLVLLDFKFLLPFFNNLAHLVSLNQGQDNTFAHCISASVAKYPGSHPVQAQVTLAHISSHLFKNHPFCCHTLL
jgi:hypothetical protein